MTNEDQDAKKPRMSEAEAVEILRPYADSKQLSYTSIQKPGKDRKGNETVEDISKLVIRDIHDRKEIDQVAEAFRGLTKIVVTTSIDGTLTIGHSSATEIAQKLAGAEVDFAGRAQLPSSAQVG